MCADDLSSRGSPDSMRSMRFKSPWRASAVLNAPWCPADLARVSPPSSGPQWLEGERRHSEARASSEDMGWREEEEAEEEEEVEEEEEGGEE